jgi:hypothetical protein
VSTVYSRGDEGLEAGVGIEPTHSSMCKSLVIPMALARYKRPTLDASESRTHDLTNLERLGLWWTC